MKLFSLTIFCKTLILSLLFIFCNIHKGIAQVSEQIYSTDPAIHAEDKGNLEFHFDNLNFFKNNEFEGYFTKGYTLPGLWVQPKVTYQPKKNIRVEAGAHLLRYWGANKYPHGDYAYRVIPEWESKKYQKGFHVSPVFRVQIAVSPTVDIVLGTLYGGANHRLIEPLYNPEMNMTADPETGLQILHRSKHLWLDAWLNWESFIFYNDYHQEVFVGGLSTRLLLNDPGSEFHFYMPVQAIAQHHGGEIDTILTNSVQTLMNGTVGAGIHWNPQRKVLKKVELEGTIAGYYEQAGSLQPFSSGIGFYVRSAAQLGNNFRIKASYWQCRDFISILGVPFYGSASGSHTDMTFDSPKLLFLGAEYTYNWGKGYALGVNFDLYHALPVTIQSPGNTWKEKAANSYTFGVYFRMSPSFLIKKFQ